MGISHIVEACNMLIDGFNIKRGVALAPVAAAVVPAVATAAVGAVANKAFGGGGKVSGGNAFSPSSGSSSQGYAAMPKYLQDIYEKQYTPALMDYFNSPEGRNPNPIAGFNPTQQQALAEGGQNIQQIQAGLQDYMNPYNQFVTDQIRRNYGMEQNKILGNAQKMGGVGALKSSSFGTQLSLNNEAMQRALAEAQYNSYRDALGLRRETLADMFEAGLMGQQQEQKQLSATAQNPYTRVKNLGELLKLIPSSAIESHVGETPAVAGTPKSSMFDRAGKFLNNIDSLQKTGALDSLYNSGVPRAGTYGAPKPGIFNSMFGI